MASFIDPVHVSERDVMEDISYFEGYDFPDSPSETPSMKYEATVTLRERTPVHINLENMFPTTPPMTPPRLGLKRSFSSQAKGSFASFGPLTPPVTPPTRFSGLSRTLSDKAFEHQISIFNSKNRPTIVTIDVINSPSLSRRSTLSRSSSYSARSATSSGSAGSNPLDRVRDYTALSTDSVFLSPTVLAQPAYSPPPNTPATFEPVHQIHDYSNLSPFDGEAIDQEHDTVQEFGKTLQNGDPFNPFAYSGPTQYPNHSSQAPSKPSNRFQGFTTQPLSGVPVPGNSSGSSIIDLEKARNKRRQNQPEKRHCARKTLICLSIFAILLVIGVIVVVVVLVKIKHHFKHHRRSVGVDVPAICVGGMWGKRYERCT